MAEEMKEKETTKTDEAAEKKNAEKPAPAEKTRKSSRAKGEKSRLIKALICLGILLVFLVATNPSLLPLPERWRNWLLEAWSAIFGDVSQISKTVSINWISIFKLVVIFIFLAIIVNLVKYFTEKIKPKQNKWKSILSLLNSMILYAAVLIGLIWGLSALGVNLSTIIASIGIVALIIGFAAESLIEDVITGFFLVFEDDFNVGDIVELDGFRGQVISIGVRVTSIKNGGGNIKIVNNSDIRDVLNKSKAQSKAIVDIPISYAADLEETEKVLAQIVAKLPKDHPEIFKEVPIYLGVQELGESSVLLRYAASVSEDNIYQATRLMNRDIKVGMDKAGIEIPFNQIVLHQAKEQ